MRVAFTHNLQRNKNEEEAEFDTIETVNAITMSLTALGHQVEPIDVSCSPAELVARLELFRPHLVFNTAEGRAGRFREAFYPALFDEIGLPYTGSDPYVCTLTLDKTLAKMIVAQHGVRVPRSIFFDTNSDLHEIPDISLPVIVKPNFEGSSKGITEDSVVDSYEGLRARVESSLIRYPEGVIAEEFIPGRDVVVAFIEGLSPDTKGVLPAVEYFFDDAIAGPRQHNIYDFNLKNVIAHAVKVKTAVGLSPKAEQALQRMASTAFRVLGVRDMGRADFRVTAEGEVYFIEVNALPSLDSGSGIYEAAKAIGAVDISAVLHAVVRSATSRRGLPLEPPTQIKTRVRRGARIGFTYNLKRIKPHGQDDDSEAEYDSPTTIAAITEALASYGHEVVALEATAEVLATIRKEEFDVVFNIAEGVRGRGREALVPALLELLDIEYTGSDPATLAVTLDKALAKQIVHQAGVATPQFAVWSTGAERLPKWVEFPVIVKPVAEGSSKGVGTTSVVRNEAELRAMAKDIIARYRQAALIEAFVGGREFTVGVLGEKRPRVLPPMEVIFCDKTETHPVYSFAHKLAGTSEVRYEAPAQLDPVLARNIERAARKSFNALGCRDVSRIDVRLDAAGTVHFIECNPLPGLTPNWSDLCLIAQGAGMSYRALIGAILAPALRRFRANARLTTSASGVDERRG